MREKNTKLVTFDRELGDPLSAQALEDLKALEALEDHEIDFPIFLRFRAAGRKTRSGSTRFSKPEKRQSPSASTPMS